MDGGGVFELLIFAGEVADDAHGGVDLAHGPAGKAVEALPVAAEDALAEFVEELGRQERRSLLAVLAADLVEQLVGEAGLRGELAHHLREQDGVGRHRRLGHDVLAMAAGWREEGAQERELAGEAHGEIRRHLCVWKKGLLRTLLSAAQIPVGHAEVAAGVEEAHQVEHAVEVALLAVGDGRVPELVDEGLLVGAGRGGEARDGGGGEHARGVAHRERLAVEGVTVDERADALRDQEGLDVVGEHGFARVFVPPAVVDRPVAGGAPGVVAEGHGLAVARPFDLG